MALSSLDDQDTKHLGAGLRALRQAKGLGQEAVAEVIETDAGSVSRIENGKRDPSLRQLRRLAPRLGFDRRRVGRLIDAATRIGSGEASVRGPGRRVARQASKDIR